MLFRNSFKANIVPFRHKFNFLADKSYYFAFDLIISRIYFSVLIWYILESDLNCYSARSVFFTYAYVYYCMLICPYVGVWACLSLCMRHKNEFGTQMKNTHTDLIRIRIRDAHTRLVKNTLRALYKNPRLL